MNPDSDTPAGKASGPSPRSGKIGTPVLIVCITAIAIACIFLAQPVHAGTKYMAGSPEMSAYISGTNEFSPGDSVSLPVVVENTGVNEYKFIQSSIVDRDDLPNTAKFVTVTLYPGDAPILVKSDPQMVGDLRASTSAVSPFSIKILSDAPAGTYTLPLSIRYTYMYTAEQYATDSIRYYYKDVNETIGIPITIKPEVQVQVVSADAGTVNAGNEGSLAITVKNTGHEDGKKTILRIARNGNSPITPTQSSVYIGEFDKDATATGTFRIQVSEDAEEQVYPVDVLVEYENSEGDTVSSDPVTIGISVGKKVEFTVTSGTAEIWAGHKKVITVQYKNTGGATVYNAQARISAVDPFTCSDDSAFLGTIAPGETKDAAFEISVAGSATPKEYGLDSEIRYRDALDNSRISDPLKVRIVVDESPGVLAGLTANPLPAGIVAVIAIAGLAFYFLWYRKRRQ